MKGFAVIHGLSGELACGLLQSGGIPPLQGFSGVKGWGKLYGLIWLVGLPWWDSAVIKCIRAQQLKIEYKVKCQTKVNGIKPSKVMVTKLSVNIP